MKEALINLKPVEIFLISWAWVFGTLFLAPFTLMLIFG